jgi:tRNA nucleotidyltransferase/poly(A) polymerase
VLEECKKKTILRVAGGWVRDKLIGKESNDIDIALDDMYGEEFAEIIR